MKNPFLMNCRSVDEISYALTGKKLNYVSIIVSMKKPPSRGILGRERREMVEQYFRFLFLFWDFGSGLEFSRHKLNFQFTFVSRFNLEWWSDGSYLYPRDG